MTNSVEPDITTQLTENRSATILGHAQHKGYAISHSCQVGSAIIHISVTCQYVGRQVNMASMAIVFYEEKHILQLQIAQRANRNVYLYERVQCSY